MSSPPEFVPPPASVVAEVAAEAERPLSPEAARAYERSPVSAQEQAGMDELIDWFLRRYPTPRERLAYGRAWTLRLRKALPKGARGAGG